MKWLLTAASRLPTRTSGLLLVDLPEAYPRDCGAIMGLHSVLLSLGQISDSLIGGAAGGIEGLDGILVATFVLIGVALLPLPLN